LEDHLNVKPTKGKQHASKKTRRSIVDEEDDNTTEVIHELEIEERKIV